MGLTDMMKQSNQSTNEDAIDRFHKHEERKEAATDDDMKHAIKVLGGTNDSASMLSNSVWSTDGLLSSSRLYQRSSSTPPAHIDAIQVVPSSTKGDTYGLYRIDLSEAVQENNQEDMEDLCRQDLVMPIGKHIQRAWSAPPVPQNFDAFCTKQSSGRDKHINQPRTSENGGLLGIAENSRTSWNDDSHDSTRSIEKTSIATISPANSPLAGRSDASSNSDGIGRKVTGFAHRGFFPVEHRSNHAFMTLVDRVQEDFPRTPSPVLGSSGGSNGVLPVHSLDHSMAIAMKQLHVESQDRISSSGGQGPRRHDRSFGVASNHPPRVHDLRQPHRVHNQPSFISSYSVVAPPGFPSQPTRGIYDSQLVSEPRTPWAHTDDGYTNNRFPSAPFDYGLVSHGLRAPFKGDFGLAKAGGFYSQHEIAGRGFHGQPTPVYPTLPGYEVQDRHLYNIPHPSPVFRTKSGLPRRHEYAVHPAHTYSSTTLLEEFKAAAKSDKWDLRAIQGHLLEFARDQTGSRFIQQKLEKADDRIREEAFEEVFPEALVLMTDVFGNYVIQKFFDHGSVEQQHRLVSVMKKNMVNLALQVYGCRVIQKALEVTQVDEQLLLIREMRGHVLKCVIDQNGNHVLQKCIEAASWKKCMSGGAQQHVLGEDIQFIIDDFVGQAAALSTHAYGCRVVQRVLEHCTPDQIRPIVNEIIFKCRELVKDQFGNYVVQHVVTHGETEQRDTVMQAILPDVAKWSQHKYASNVVEACLDCASKQEISQVIDLILDCDETGSSCALLPMMKHMYGNYVVQKLLDRADRNDRQRIFRIIQHNADYLKRFTYGKHVLSRLERDSSSGLRESHGGRYY